MMTIDLTLFVKSFSFAAICPIRFWLMSVIRIFFAERERTEVVTVLWKNRGDPLALVRGSFFDGGLTAGALCAIIAG